MDITSKQGTKYSEEYHECYSHNVFIKYVLRNYSADKSEGSSLAALKSILHLFGMLIQVVVEGGPEFLGEFKSYFNHYGINVDVIPPRISQANGQAERVICMLKNALTMIKNYKTENYKTALETLQLAFNFTRYRVPGVIPLTLDTSSALCSS
ncbi:unnamed protein product, partial [Brenthis ino]